MTQRFLLACTLVQTAGESSGVRSVETRRDTFTVCQESRAIIQARLPSNLAILPHLGGSKIASNLGILV